jgi:hypothetical protein
MGTIFVDNLEPQSGTSLTLGASGDTISLASGATAGFGKIGQVIQTVGTGTTTTASTSFTEFLSVDITPTSTSSKVLIQFSGGGSNGGSGYQAFFTIYRNDTTNLATSGNSGFGKFYNPDNLGTFASITFLDSPSSTSSTQYSLYVRSASGSQTVKMGEDGSNYTITVMEVLP